MQNHDGFCPLTRKEVMESPDLEKTLKTLKEISDLERGLAEFYSFCSGIREEEKDFWLNLKQDEEKHARLVQEMAQRFGQGHSLLVANTSFNVAPVYNLKNSIAKSIKRLQSYEVPADLKTLLSIAWNFEYSISEIKYGDLFSIAEQEYEKWMQTILSETASHRAKLGSRITVLRNNPAKAHNRKLTKLQNGPQRRSNQKGHPLKPA